MERGRERRGERGESIPEGVCEKERERQLRLLWARFRLADPIAFKFESEIQKRS